MQNAHNEIKITNDRSTGTLTCFCIKIQLKVTVNFANKSNRIESLIFDNVCNAEKQYQ